MRGVPLLTAETDHPPQLVSDARPRLLERRSKWIRRDDGRNALWCDDGGIRQIGDEQPACLLLDEPRIAYEIVHAGQLTVTRSEGDVAPDVEHAPGAIDASERQR